MSSPRRKDVDVKVIVLTEYGFDLCHNEVDLVLRRRRARSGLVGHVCRPDEGVVLVTKDEDESAITGFRQEDALPWREETLLEYDMCAS